MFHFRHLTLPVVKVKATRLFLSYMASLKSDLHKMIQLNRPINLRGLAAEKRDSFNIFTFWPVVKVTAPNFNCVLWKPPDTLYLAFKSHNSHINILGDMNTCELFNIWPWTQSRSKLHVWLRVRTEFPSSATYPDSCSLIGPQTWDPAVDRQADRQTK